MTTTDNLSTSDPRNAGPSGIGQPVHWTYLRDRSTPRTPDAAAQPVDPTLVLVRHDAGAMAPDGQWSAARWMPRAQATAQGLNDRIVMPLPPASMQAAPWPTRLLRAVQGWVSRWR